MNWILFVIQNTSALNFSTRSALEGWGPIGSQKVNRTEFQKRLLDTCGGFASTLRADYEKALHIVFQDYASSLTAVRAHLAREKIAIEPKLKRWRELFLTLKAIEQEL